jgi:tetratricopeptide (TPR) repeat protein
MLHDSWHDRQKHEAMMGTRGRFILLFSLAMLPAWAQALPLEEQPLYGEMPKTADTQKADDQFIAAAVKYGTRAQTSDHSVTLGWQYLAKHDVPTAMKRFNQAWLLDPGNGNAFHGFAVIVMDRDHDSARADKLFQQGIAAPRQSPGIYLDYGRFLLKKKLPADALPPLRKALNVPTMGADAESLLTMALYESGDLAAACTERQKLRDGGQADVLASARAVTASCN